MEVGRVAGILYGVGVGPGDPKMMTYQAVEVIKESPVIAVPADGKQKAVSYKIAAGLIENLEEKYCLNLSTPMTKNQEILNQAYIFAADEIIEQLKKGNDVAYLTLGDPTIYCTYIYIHRLVKERGFEAKIINGVPSFCAVSAKLSDSLVDRAQQLHIIPSSYEIEEALNLPGTKILMKSASKISQVKEKLRQEGKQAAMIENCGMPGEHIYRSTEEIPENAGYFSIVVVKDEI